jgi:serine/threonine protein phosphatase PrpC
MSAARSFLEIKAIGTFQSQGKRKVQEDFLICQRDRGIFIAADGFGGLVTEPAKNACEAIQSFLFKEAGDLDATLPFVLRRYFSLAGNVLFNALIHANRKLRALNQEKSVHEKGGASVVAGFLDGNLLAIASVGDCQASLYRGDQVANLVVPRSLGRMIDPFAAQIRPEQRIPLMALGMTDDLEPEIVEYQIRPGDWLVFSTDGVQSEITSILSGIKANKLNHAEAIKNFHKSLDSLTFEDNAVISLIIF